MSNVFITPFIREQRYFPRNDVGLLATEVDQAYLDLAGKINQRTIGLYALNTATVTGDRWYLQGQPNKQQTLRQVYVFTAVGSYPHGINFASVSQMTKPSGTFTDGTNYYGCIYASNVAIAGQLTFYVTPTNIVILAGAGAPSPTKITIILEWLSQF